MKCNSFVRLSKKLQLKECSHPCCVWAKISYYHNSTCSPTCRTKCQSTSSNQPRESYVSKVLGSSNRVQRTCSSDSCPVCQVCMNMQCLSPRQYHSHTSYIIHNQQHEHHQLYCSATVQQLVERCGKIAEAEAAVSVNGKKWLVMHMHVQLKLDEPRGPPKPWLTVT